MLVYLVTSTSTLKTLFSGLQDTGTQGELGHIRAYVHNATFSTERREIHKGAVQLVLQRSVCPRFPATRRQFAIEWSGIFIETSIHSETRYLGGKK